MITKFELPVRQGPTPKIGQEPPQLQFSDLGPESIKLALKQWAFSAFPHAKVNRRQAKQNCEEKNTTPKATFSDFLKLIS